MNNKLPMMSSEVVHRVFEILKFFNTRTCQLVLGAGAMQVCLLGLPYVFFTIQTNPNRTLSPNQLGLAVGEIFFPIEVFRGPFLSVFDS